MFEIALFWGVGIFVGLYSYFLRSARKAEKARLERIRRAYDYNPQTHGSALYADDGHLALAGYFKSRGIRIGFSPNGKRLYFNTAGHLLVVAGARTGKAVTILVETILSL